MRKLDYLHPRKLNPADELRDLLQQLENSQPQLKTMNPTQALTTLRNLDQAYDLFAELEVTGADLEAERGRFTSIQAHLKKYVGPFLKGLGGPAALSEYRPQPAPSRERWWWYIHEMVAAHQKRIMKQIMIIVGSIVVVIVGLIIAFNTVLAPSPEAIARLQGENRSLDAFDLGDYEGALAAVDTAREVIPNDVTLLILRGIFLETLGREQESHDSFEQAQQAIDEPADFYVGRAQYYLRTNQVDKAEGDIRTALDIDDTIAHAWLMLGQVLEVQDRRGEAIMAYQQASNLAIENGDNEVVVLARLALGRISAAP
ncbi:MAG: tetratricopeptide repeat protein [Anaerolineae bacterium]|nr:tetratricopeptide repeat protein [Anaerolineae bacterium]